MSPTKIQLIPVSWRSFPALPGPEHAGIHADQMFSGVPADVITRVPFPRKETAYPRAPSLDAAHQFTLYPVELGWVAPGEAEQGYRVPSCAGDPESDLWSPDLQCKR